MEEIEKKAHHNHNTHSLDNAESNQVEETAVEQKAVEHDGKKSFIHDKLILVLLLVFVLTTGALSLRSLNLFNQSQKPQATKVITKEVLVRRSKIPNVIAKATTAKIIDVKTGRVIQAARVFSLNDKTVYLSLDLNSPSVNTRIDYIRYLNGRYVDHGSIKITKPDTQNLAFQWTVNKLLGSRPDGRYKIATYTNGVLEKRVNYTVDKNKVAGVWIENPTSSDPDYHLTSTLATQSK